MDYNPDPDFPAAVPPPQSGPNARTYAKKEPLPIGRQAPWLTGTRDLGEMAKVAGAKPHYIVVGEVVDGMMGPKRCDLHSKLQYAFTDYAVRNWHDILKKKPLGECRLGPLDSVGDRELRIHARIYRARYGIAVWTYGRLRPHQEIYGNEAEETFSNTFVAHRDGGCVFSQPEFFNFCSYIPGLFWDQLMPQGGLTPNTLQNCANELLRQCGGKIPDGISALEYAVACIRADLVPATLKEEVRVSPSLLGMALLVVQLNKLLRDHPPPNATVGEGARISEEEAQSILAAARRQGSVMDGSEPRGTRRTTRSTEPQESGGVDGRRASHQ